MLTACSEEPGTDDIPSFLPFTHNYISNWGFSEEYLDDFIESWGWTEDSDYAAYYKFMYPGNSYFIKSISFFISQIQTVSTRFAADFLTCAEKS
ncbi:hypothetical protein FACS189429_3260 [Bacteroidia bacterium]|nr:hypothetical protein FACS189429_3260 [Bacteroidia bacterium]GHV45055.1 hypothetical protein FACS1894180_7170 [Bacteroidia bacterium]